MNYLRSHLVTASLLALALALPSQAKIWTSQNIQKNTTNVIGKVRRRSSHSQSSSQVRSLGTPAPRFLSGGTGFGGSSVVYGPGGTAYLVPGVVGGYSGTNTSFQGGFTSSGQVGRASFPSQTLQTGPKNAAEAATLRIQSGLEAGQRSPAAAAVTDPSRARFDRAASAFRRRYGFSD